MTTRDHFNLSPKVKKKRLNMLPQNPEKKEEENAVGPGRFPSWLHRKLPKGNALWKTGDIIGSKRLHTVCEEAKCPNLLECWSRKTATFLVLGKACTRSCGFCDIDFTKAPAAPEPDEPERIAQSVLELGLKHVVITQVARDDLPDGGASHLALIMAKIRQTSPHATIEVLASDLEGKESSLDIVLKNPPEIFNHNIETIRELSPRVRHKATYDRSMGVLKYVSQKKTPKLQVKSGMMVGFGETVQQVYETIDDLKEAGCDIITIGQYLQANHNKLLVKEFVTPDQFKSYEEYGYSVGVKFMYCGPFIRSSYNADQVIEESSKL